MTESSAMRQMHLAAFFSAGPVSGHHGGWRYPGADLSLLSSGYYQRIGQLLEHGKFDMVFCADILAVPDRFKESRESQLRYGALGALRLDPMLVLTAIASATSRLGLACTVSTSYQDPFTVARAFATLDHLSGGRAAWNVVTSFQDAEARNFGREGQNPRDRRYDRADEFLEVVCKLWDSWDDEALSLDPGPPLFADSDHISAIDHDGEWFGVAGPLNVSRSPQGRPVLVQAGASSRGKDFAARWADVIFTTPPTIESGKAFYQELKERAAALGRNPSSLKILPGIVPVIGETETIASEKRRLLEELVHPLAGLSTLAYHLDVDLSQFAMDQPLPTVDVPGVHGHYLEVAEVTQREGLTLEQLGRRYGSGPNSAFIGTAPKVAATMAEWFAAGACDGFMIQGTHAPGGYEDVVRLLVPELQKLGIFRCDYDGPTLRDHLGIERPAPGDWLRTDETAPTPAENLRRHPGEPGTPRPRGRLAS
jgi:FMN-dependent oxidoreductase (nitrilotriacetate monooxygenase family)